MGLGVGLGGEPSLSLSLARRTSLCSRSEAATRRSVPTPFSCTSAARICFHSSYAGSHLVRDRARVRVRKVYP